MSLYFAYSRHMYALTYLFFLQLQAILFQNMAICKSYFVESNGMLYFLYYSEVVIMEPFFWKKKMVWMII